VHRGVIQRVSDVHAAAAGADDDMSVDH
jgi:hypothetical protein